MQALLAYGSKSSVPESKKREVTDESSSKKRDEEELQKKAKVAPSSILPGLDSDSDNEKLADGDDSFQPVKQAKTAPSTPGNASFSSNAKKPFMIPPQVRTGVPNIVTEDRESLFSSKAKK